MNMYHREVGFPDSLLIPDLKVKLKYCDHTLEKNLKILPKYIRINKTNIFEVSTFDDIKIKKALVRINYDEKRDMVLVLQILSKAWARVITVWLNKKQDKHYTLDKTKYKIPKNQQT